MTERFIVGVIGAPFGIKGFVKVHPLSGEIDHLLKLKSVIVNKDGKERLLQIEESAPALPSLLIRFEGINSPEDAKTLNGAQLFVNRAEAAPLEDGEFYVEDLKGLNVFVNNNEILSFNSSLNLCTSVPPCELFSIIGTITDVIEGGGGDLVEIELTDGIKKLVPFRKEFFPDINPEKSRIILRNLWILE